MAVKIEIARSKLMNAWKRETIEGFLQLTGE